jgi:hypothetical protein
LKSWRFFAKTGFLVFVVGKEDSLSKFKILNVGINFLVQIPNSKLRSKKSWNNLEHGTDGNVFVPNPKIYENTMSQLLKSEEYLDSAGESFIQALEEMVDFVVGDSDTSTFDAQRDLQIDELLGGCPKEVKEPNFGGLGTVSAVAKVVLKHWLPIF